MPFKSEDRLCPRSVWIGFYATICVSLLCSVSSGEVPQVIALVSELNSFENNLTRVEAEYRTRHGIGNPSQINEEPQWGESEIKGVYTRDLDADTRYVQEDTISEESTRRVSGAFDGTVGTALWSLGDKIGTGWTGIISADMPDILSDDVIRLRPNELTYNITEGQPLSRLLQSAEEIRMVKDTYKGVTGLVIEFISREPKVVTYNGSDRTITVTSKFKVVLDTKHNLLPVYVEKYHVPPIEGTPPTLSWIKQVLEVEEVEEGIWFPKRSRFSNIWPSKVRVIETEIASISIGTKAKCPAAIKFPDGTHITDERKMIKYQLGFSDSRIQENIEKYAGKDSRGGERDVQVRGIPASNMTDGISSRNGAREHSSLQAFDNWYVYVGSVCIVVFVIVVMAHFVVRRRRRAEG